MENTQSQIDEFLQLVLKNLEKNGFPEKAVSFPLDKMYESASRRGFSFNKIRTLLQEQKISTELTTEHVIFRIAAESSETDPFAAMAEDSELANMAQEMLRNMSQEQLKQMQEMMAQLKPEDFASMRAQWEAMPEGEKERLLAAMQKPGGPTPSP